MSSYSRFLLEITNHRFKQAERKAGYGIAVGAVLGGFFAFWNHAGASVWIALVLILIVGMFLSLDSYRRRFRLVGKVTRIEPQVSCFLEESNGGAETRKPPGYLLLVHGQTFRVTTARAQSAGLRAGPGQTVVLEVISWGEFRSGLEVRKLEVVPTEN